MTSAHRRLRRRLYDAVPEEREAHFAELAESKRGARLGMASQFRGTR